MPHWFWKTSLLGAVLIAALVLAHVASSAQSVEVGAEGRRVLTIELFVESRGEVFERAPESARRQEILGSMRTRPGVEFRSQDLARDLALLTEGKHMFRNASANVSVDRAIDGVRVQLILTQPLVHRVRLLAHVPGVGMTEDGVRDPYRFLAAIDTTEGAEFSLRRLDVDVRRLAESGAFLHVRAEHLYTPDGVDVVFRLIPNQALSIVTFSGINAPGVTTDLRRVLAGQQTVREAAEGDDRSIVSPVYFPLAAFDGDVVTDASAANILGAKEQIRAFYRSRGYHFAEVHERVIGLPTAFDLEALERDYGTMREGMQETVRRLIEQGYGGRTVLVFEIFEGEPLRIGSIFFTGIRDIDSPGNDALSVDRLSGFFSLVYKTWYSLFASSDRRKGAVLGEVMRSKEGDFYVESDATRDAEALQSYLQQRGWLDARVSFGSVQFNEVRSRVNLFFHVDPGSVYAITDVRIEYATRAPRVPEGAEPLEYDPPAVTMEELLKAIRLSGDEISDEEAVRRFTQAYVNASLRPEQGRHFGAFDLDSPIPFDQYRLTGSPMDFSEGMAGMIRMLLADRGYSNIELDFERVETEEDFIETGWKSPWPVRRVGLIVRVQQGYQSIVGKVTFRGNIETRDDVLRRYVSLYPGDVYDSNRLRRSDARLRRTQWFQQASPGQGVVSRTSARLVISEGEYIEYTDIDYDLEEGPTNRLNFSAGFNTVTGFTASIDMTLMNFDISSAVFWLYGGRYTGFVGAGQSLSFTLQPPLDRQQIYRVSFNEPWLFGYPLSGGISGEYTAIDYGTYTRSRTGVDPVIGWRVHPDVLWSFGYSYSILGLSNVSRAAPPELRADAGRDISSTVWSEIRWDTTDSPIFPTEGFVLSYRYAYTGGPVLGGTLDFWRMRASANYYLPVAELDPIRRLVLAFNLTGHWQDVHSDMRQIPFVERFLLGGNTLTGRGLLRGYEFAGVGPSRNNLAIGGNFMVHGYTELRLPIFPGSLWAVSFIDVGQLSPTLNTFNLTGWTVSGGAGLRLLLPILPVPFALDFGFPIYDQPGNRAQVVSINLGLGF